MKKLSVLTAVLLLLGSAAFAEETHPRLISVTGEGEVYAIPDEVWVNLQVESFNERLAPAKKSNDEAIQQVLDIVKKYGIDAKDFRTDYFTVRNEERYYMDPQTNQQRSKKGFFVTKNVAVIIRDVTKFEPLYSEALEAGVNNIFGVEFKTHDIKKYQDEARMLAVRAAKEKAQQIAKELNEELARTASVQENAQSSWPVPMPMMAMAKSADSSSANETIALGQIKISSSVTASFEMK